MDFLIGLLVFLTVFLLYQLFNRKKYPPGPIPYPFFGSSSIIKKLSRKHGALHFALEELSQMYKTNILSLKLGRSYTVVVQSEELVNQVLNNDEFQGRPDNFFIRLRCMGKRIGITMNDGTQWYEQRTFAVKHLHDLGLGKKRMTELIKGQLQDLLDSLNSADIINMSFRKLLSKSVLNVLWEIVTGENFKNNEKQLVDLISFMEERAKVFDMSGGLISQFPFLRYICPEYCGYSLIQKLNQRFKDMIMAVIEEHKENYNKDVTNDYIDAFMHKMYNNNGLKPSSFTDEQLVMVCLDFFIAGSQTTSSFLDFLLLHMVRNPSIQEKVQDELDGVLKPGQVPSCADRMKCPYTDAVINEVHRLTPVTPIIGPRRVTRDTVIDGYIIPKETTILLNLHACNMNPGVWVNPEVFSPERFLNENGKMITETQLFSFGKGKRRCPGEALAKNFTFIFFAGLLHNYKFLPKDGENLPPLKIIPGITQSPAEYSIKMVKRFS